jgi:hypothetical protein
VGGVLSYSPPHARGCVWSVQPKIETSRGGHGVLEQIKFISKPMFCLYYTLQDLKYLSILYVLCARSGRDLERVSTMSGGPYDERPVLPPVTPDEARAKAVEARERPVLPPVTPAEARAKAVEARAKAVAALKTATKAIGTTREAGLAAVKAAEEALETTREAALTADKAAEKALTTATAVIAAAAWSLEAAAASKRAKRE